jgi:hypothetical protein
MMLVSSLSLLTIAAMPFLLNAMHEQTTTDKVALTDEEKNVIEKFKEMCCKPPIGSGNILWYPIVDLGKRKTFVMLRSGALVTEDTLVTLVAGAKGGCPTAIALPSSAIDLVNLEPIYVILLLANFVEFKHDEKKLVTTFKLPQINNDILQRLRTYTGASSFGAVTDVKEAAKLILGAFRTYLDTLAALLEKDTAKYKEARSGGIAAPCEHNFQFTSVIDLLTQKNNIDMIFEALSEDDTDLTVRMVRFLFLGGGSHKDTEIVVAGLKKHLPDLNELINLMLRCLHTEVQLSVLMEMGEKAGLLSPQREQKVISLLNPCISCQMLPLVIESAKTNGFLYFDWDNDFLDAIKKQVDKLIDESKPIEKQVLHDFLKKKVYLNNWKHFNQDIGRLATEFLTTAAGIAYVKDAKKKFKLENFLENVKKKQEILHRCFHESAQTDKCEILLWVKENSKDELQRISGCAFGAVQSIVNIILGWKNELIYYQKYRKQIINWYEYKTNKMIPTLDDDYEYEILARIITEKQKKLAEGISLGFTAVDFLLLNVPELLLELLYLIDFVHPELLPKMDVHPIFLRAETEKFYQLCNNLQSALQSMNIQPEKNQYTDSEAYK